MMRSTDNGLEIKKQPMNPTTIRQIDPSDPRYQELMKKKQQRKILNIAISFGGMLLVFGFVFSSLIFPSIKNKKLLETGLPARATILEIKPTGNVYNNQPQARLKLKVQLENGETYETEMTMIVNPIYVPQFQPGKDVKIRYDANDRNNIVIEDTL